MSLSRSSDFNLSIVNPFTPSPGGGTIAFRNITDGDHGPKLADMTTRIVVTTMEVAEILRLVRANASRCQVCSRRFSRLDGAEGPNGAKQTVDWATRVANQLRSVFPCEVGQHLIFLRDGR
jgi:hypothetical protein